MQIVPPAFRMEVMMQAANTQLKSPVNLRTVLDAVNPDEGLLAYFDPVGHGRWRGVHGLN
jgi:hypothetical protein